MRLQRFCGMMLLFIAAGLSAQAYRLAYKGTDGAVNTYNIRVNSTTSSAVQGNKIDIIGTTTLTAVETVLSAAPDGTLALSYQLKDRKSTMTLPVPGAKPMDTPLPDMRFTCNRDSSGKVSNLVINGTVSGKTAEYQLNNLMSQLYFPGKGMEFPDKELRVGDSWDVHRSVEVAQGAPVDLKGNMTLAGTQVIGVKNYLIIKSTITAEYKNLTIPASAAPQSGGTPSQPMTLNGSMNMQDTTLFDEQTGEIFRSSVMTTIIMQPTTGGDPSVTRPTRRTINMQVTRVQ